MSNKLLFLGIHEPIYSQSPFYELSYKGVCIRGVAIEIIFSDPSLGNFVEFS